MKNLLILLAIILMASCSKVSENSVCEENVVALRRASDCPIIYDSRLNHNDRLENLVESVIDNSCNTDAVFINNIYNQEFAVEFETIKGHYFENLFRDAVLVRMSTKLLNERFYYNRNRNLNVFPTIVKEYILTVENNIPDKFMAVLKSNYYKMLNGEINNANFENQLNSSCDFLLGVLESDMECAIEGYRRVAIDSYKYWNEGCMECEGKYSALQNCLVFDGDDWTGGVEEMNDNDWPNEATTPVWVDRDILGFLGGLFGGASPWGSAGVGVCASLAP
jgi:hypothetical protein